MLFLYNLKEFLKAFSVLTLVFVSILSLYALLDVFLLYRLPALSILPKVMLNTILVSFYYTAPIINSLALMLYLKRVFSKSYDRIASAFGVSPLGFLSPIILFSLALSFLQLILSHSIYPKAFKTVYLIEREFKKGKQPEELVLNNLWLSLNTEGKNLYVRIGFADLRKNQVYDVFFVSTKDGYITELITAEEGYWEGDRLRLKEAEINHFDAGLQERSDVSLSFVPLKEGKAFGERLEHLSMDRLLSLYLLAGKIGMNRELYLAELLRRLIVSSCVLLLPLALSARLLKERAFLKPSAYFLLYACMYILSLNSVKIVAEQFGKTPLIGAIPYLALILISARSLYYLGKGHRV